MKEVNELAIITIPASKSLTVTDRFPDTGINAKIIKVGSDGKYTYFSYLFFDFSSIPSNVRILNAELVLFKTNNFYDNDDIVFYIYPLKDYFSSLTTYSNRPSIIYQIKKEFYPVTSKVSVTIDLTDFVSLWIENKLPNRGIALVERANNCLVKFGSSVCPDSYLTPFIKVVFTPHIYDHNYNKQINKNCKQYFYQKFYQNCYPICYPKAPTIRQVHVIGTVAPESTYVAAIIVKVTRNGSGDINNYYVTDEYDNSLNDKPLSIDKIYDVVINPGISDGDTEEVNFYGSYKI